MRMLSGIQCIPCASKYPRSNLAILKSQYCCFALLASICYMHHVIVLLRSRYFHQLMSSSHNVIRTSFEIRIRFLASCDEARYLAFQDLRRPVRKPNRLFSKQAHYRPHYQPPTRLAGSLQKP